MNAQSRGSGVVGGGPGEVAGVRDEAGAGEHADGPLGRDVDHEGVARVAVGHEGHDAVGTGVGRLHHTFGTVDSHEDHPITRV
jgi:hypothetical protein